MISGTQQRMKLILSVLLTCSLSSHSHVACFQYSSASLVRNKPVAPIAHSSFHKTLLFAADSDSSATFDIIIADAVTVDSSKSGSTERILSNERSICDEEQNEISNRMILTIMALIFVVTSLSALDRVAMSVALVPLSQEMGYTDTVKGSISSFFSVGYGLGRSRNLGQVIFFSF
jgi:hypothetical protein